MITLPPPPYHLIKTTLDMDMNAKQRRQAKRRVQFFKNRTEVSEIDQHAMNAQRIDADPELTTNKTAWIIAGCLLLSILGGICAAWS